MAFEAGAITGRVSLDEAPMVKALKNAEEQSVYFKREVDKNMNGVAESMKRSAHEGESAWKGMLENLKGGLGRRSAFGETMELLAGGGVVMGLSLASEKLNELTQKAQELKALFKDPNATGGDIAEGFARAIPILGQFWEAGRNIRDVFTGEKEEAEEVANHIKEQNKAFEERTRLIKEGAEAQKQFGDELRSLDQQLAILNSGGGANEALLRVTQDKDNATKKADDDYSKGAKLDEIDKAKREAEIAKRDLRLANRDFNLAKANQDNPGEGDRLLGRSKADIDPQIRARVAAQDAYTKANQHLQDLQNNEKKLREDHAKAIETIEKFAAEKTKQIEDGNVKRAKDAFAKMHEDYAKAQADARKPIDDAQKLIDQSGMTEGQKKFDDLKRANATTGLLSDGDLNKAKALFDRMDAIQKNNKLKEDAEAIKKSLESPAEKFADAVKKIKAELDIHALTPEQAKRATDLAHKEAFGDDNKRPGLIRAGSAEAQAARYDGGHAQSQLAIAQKTLAVLELIENHTKKSATLTGDSSEVPGSLCDLQGLA